MKGEQNRDTTYPLSSKAKYEIAQNAKTKDKIVKNQRNIFDSNANRDN